MEEKRSPYSLAFKALAILGLVAVFLFLIVSPKTERPLSQGLGEALREGVAQVQQDMTRPLSPPKKDEPKKEAAQ